MKEEGKEEGWEGGREGPREGGAHAQFLNFTQAASYSPHTYLLAQRRIKDPVVPKHLPQAHGATKDAAKRHVFPENDLFE